MIVRALLFSAVILSPAISANDELKQALAERLYISLNVEPLIKASLQTRLDAQSKQFAMQKMSPAAIKLINAQQEQQFNLLVSEIFDEDGKRKIVKAYADVFTYQELKDVVEFYESPAGKKFTAKQPELNNYLMKSIDAEIQHVMPQIIEMHRQLQYKLATLN